MKGGGARTVRPVHCSSWWSTPIPRASAIGSRSKWARRSSSDGKSPEFGHEPLLDTKISTAHIEVRPELDRLSIRDAGSKNGIFVADESGVEKRVEHGHVERGAFLRIGATFLRFLVEPPFPVERGGELVGISQAVHELRRAIDATGLHDRPVLIVGPTGSGKELVARAVHRVSKRKGELVPFNCATLSNTLAEAELFGHTKGAFTGADRERPGLFREAAPGTVFLDEIATLPAELQPKLLRVLQERSVRPVGASRETPIDVRVVAATNESLAELAAAGRFREDLCARLLGARIAVPSLEERREDIVLVARTLLARAGFEAVRFSEALTSRLLHARWPLNVRALEQILLAAAPLAEEGVLDVTREVEALLDEQNALHPSSARRRALVAKPGVGVRVPIDRPETAGARSYTRKPTREDLVARLEQAGGNVAKLADEYGVRRQQIYRWAEALGVDLAAYRERERDVR
jgi:DNA-binding NtrC family response regulator